MSKYLLGAIVGFVLAVGAILPLPISGADAERPLTPLEPQDFQSEFWILSENVQRLARDQQIWRRQQFANVESYVDLLTLVDMIAKRRFAEQQRLGSADIDEEYYASFALLCFIPLPGKPPRYADEMQIIRMRLAAKTFSSSKARQYALSYVKPSAYRIPASELRRIKDLSPSMFFGAQ